MKWLVKWPMFGSLFVIIEFLIQMSINIKLNFLSIPFNAIYVKLLSSIFYQVAFGLLSSDYMVKCAGVNTSINSVWYISDIFHDINFSAMGPMSILIIS